LTRRAVVVVPELGTSRTWPIAPGRVRPSSEPSLAVAKPTASDVVRARARHPPDRPTTLRVRRPICRRDLTRGTSREQFETCRPRKKAAARGADSNGLQATRHRDEIGRGPVRVARAGERRSYDRCPRRAWNRWHPRLGRSCACGPVFREALNHVSRLGPERPGSPRSFLNPPRSTKARLARRVGPSGSFCRTERYET
jgi:hypothetical protein